MDLALPDPDRYDLVILAGDIHSHTYAIPWATRTFAKPVIYLPGNHEVYGVHYQGLWAELRKCAAQHGHVHLLDNETIEVDGVRICGAMLWTGFILHDSDMGMIGRCMSEAKRGMPDFSRIRFRGGGLLSPADILRLYRESACFIAQDLAHRVSWCDLMLGSEHRWSPM